MITFHEGLCLVGSIIIGWGILFGTIFGTFHLIRWYHTRIKKERLLKTDPPSPFAKALEQTKEGRFG